MAAPAAARVHPTLLRRQIAMLFRLTPLDEPHAFVAAVEARVAALARAHSLLATKGWAGADLPILAEWELAAFQLRAGPRAASVTLLGPTIPLRAVAVQPLALVLHELASNALKHGALSRPDGRVAALDAVQLPAEAYIGRDASTPPIHATQCRNAAKGRLVGSWAAAGYSTRVHMAAPPGSHRRRPLRVASPRREAALVRH